MKKRTLSILLIIVMAVCFAGALYYPIQYFLQKESTEMDMEDLRAMRRSALENSADPTQAAGTIMTDGSSEPEEEVPTIGGAALTEAAVGGYESSAPTKASATATQIPITATDGAEGVEQNAEPSSANVKMTAEPLNETAAVTEIPQQPVTTSAVQPEATAVSEAISEQHSENSETTKPIPAATNGDAGAMVQPDTTMAAATSEPEKVEPTPTPMDRYYTESSVLPYSMKEKVELDTELILPQYRDIYKLNNDMVGWLHIPGTYIDYPVVQSEDPDYYLRRDFYGESNDNGQLILDASCDPWTPSYNLVISGHNMKSGMMFGHLSLYTSKSFWASNKTFTYDSLMREGTYVVIAVFYSADYDEDEEGFRYNANIQYRRDVEQWLEDVRENREYDTGIDAEFGDEFLTLTTCLYHRENGRFVVIARRVRDGEVIE